ncbi:MAG: hypothetical protein K6U79_00970 [Firmicutes bacterium]|nr:hypothetical protein [Bacillota bacterium]
MATRPAAARPLAVILTGFLVLLLSAPFLGPGRALAAGGATAPAASDGGRVVLVLLPYVDWPDLAGGDLPAFRRLEREGATGLVNVLTPQRNAPATAALALGSASIQPGAPGLAEAYQRGERIPAALADAGARAAEVYAWRYGRRPPAGRAILELGMGPLLAQAAAAPLAVQPPYGFLGDALHAAGFETAVLGNSDAAGLPQRFAVPAAMDGAWSVDAGEVDDGLLVADASFPGGVRTSLSRLLAAYDRLPPRVGLVVVEAGDMARVESEASAMSPAALQAARRQALTGADRLVGALQARLDPRRDLLLVLSLAPTPAAGRQDAYLVPVFAWGKGVAAGSLLTSPTTRQAGVVEVTDVAPTVLEALGVTPPAEPGVTGRPMGTVAAADPVAAVQAIYTSTLANAARRPSLLYFFVISGIVLFFASAAALVAIHLSRPATAARIRRLLRAALVAFSLSPLALLLLAFFPQLGPGTSMALFLAMLAVLGALALRLPAPRGRRLLAPLLWIDLATVAFVLGDLLTGSWADANSPLGYSALYAARFYGLGNEYGGVLIGASLMGVTGLLDLLGNRRGWREAAVLLFAVIGAVLLDPELGANFGIALAALVGYFVATVRLWGRRLGVREAVLAVLLLLVGTGVMVGIDLLAGHASHIGRAFAQAAQGGGGLADFLALVAGKLGMNWKLIRLTNWSWLFLAALFLYLLVALRPGGFGEAFEKRHPALVAGFAGAALGSVAALLFNDSGIVAAATAMVYVSPPAIVLAAYRDGGAEGGNP